MAEGTCSEDGCDNIVYCKRLCQQHYTAAWKATRSPKVPKPRKPRERNHTFTRRYDRTAGGVSKLYITDEDTGKTDCVLFDDADYDLVSQYNWRVPAEPRYPTATPKGQRREVRLHRVLFNCTPGDGVYIDHADGDTLNNTRGNLRKVSNADNIKHQAIRNDKGSSRYRNVYWSNHNKAWIGQVKHGGRMNYVGMFYDEDEAGAAVARWRKQNGLPSGY